MKLKEVIYPTADGTAKAVYVIVTRDTNHTVYLAFLGQDPKNLPGMPAFMHRVARAVRAICDCEGIRYEGITYVDGTFYEVVTRAGYATLNPGYLGVDFLVISNLWGTDFPSVERYPREVSGEPREIIEAFRHLS